MSQKMRNYPVLMIRDTLADIPEYELPAEFSLRWYEPGMEETWRFIQAESDRHNTITHSLHSEEFGSDPTVLSTRQCFLYHGTDDPVGTVSAWFNDTFLDGTYGRIHWLAILPSWQGKGLAKPLLSLTCRRFIELGHDRAYLTTDSVRLPAISLYLKFGFRPWIKTEKDHSAWASIQLQALDEYLKDG